MKTSTAQDVVHWEAAAAAIQAAARKAEEMGVKVNVAVVDPGGNLAGFLRMPGAFLHSIDIAIDKAYTAAGFGIPDLLPHGHTTDLEVRSVQLEHDGHEKESIHRSADHWISESG
jgi:uncharacterized protein GlcG (DUF336 family)